MDESERAREGEGERERGREEKEKEIKIESGWLSEVLGGTWLLGAVVVFEQAQSVQTRRISTDNKGG